MADICIVCGKEYVKNKYNQISCGDKACKYHLAKTRLERSRTKASEVEPEFVTRSRLEIARIAAEAKKAGMSYGLYVGLKYQKENWV